MWWIAFVVLQAVMLISGIRRAERARRWSWSGFVFALGFAALEGVLISAPLFLMNMNNRYFWLVYGAAWVVAAGNFVWFLMVMRRWKFKDGKTSLDANQQNRR